MEEVTPPEEEIKKEEQRVPRQYVSYHESTNQVEGAVGDIVKVEFNLLDYADSIYDPDTYYTTEDESIKIMIPAVILKTLPDNKALISGTTDLKTRKITIQGIVDIDDILDVIDPSQIKDFKLSYK